MKKLSVIFTIFSLFFISCVSDDDAVAVGYPCSVDGEEACSESGYEILVCWNELWQQKKSCNINYGEYCHETASGKLTCSDKENYPDTGDTSDTDISDTGITDNDITDSDNNDTTPEQPDTDTSDTGITDVDNDDIDDNDPTEPDENPDEDTDPTTPDPTNPDPTTPNPCDPNPCGEHSTGCTAIDETNYECSCVDGYSWSNNACEPTAETKCVQAEGTWNAEQSKCTKTVQCDEIPAENAEWNGESSYTQEYANGTWSAPTATEYSETPGTCRYKCAANYFRYGENCVNPCEPNPCSSIANTDSSHTCTAINATTFSCGCAESHFWDGTNCADPCDPNPCNSIANTDEAHTCTAINATKFECGCKEDYFWSGSFCSFSLNIGNICTGQEKCFSKNAEITCPASESEDYFGQDSQYSFCKEQDFEIVTADNGEKIVVDRNTKLEWTRTVWKDSKQTEAVTRCEELSYAGHDDWRLPEPQELLTIVDSSRMEPPVDPEYFPDVTTAVYSTKKGTAATSYFYYLTTNGFLTNTSYNTTVYNYNVICVRGEALPAASYTTATVEGKDVVTDTTTGLMWQKTYSSAMNWQNALKYCETGDGSNYAGYTDWRMPNRNELASLLDFTKTSSPYTDFPGITNSQTLWSSTTAVNNPANAIAAKFGDSSVTFYSGKTTASVPRVLCVRNAD